MTTDIAEALAASRADLLGHFGGSARLRAAAWRALASRRRPTATHYRIALADTRREGAISAWLAEPLAEAIATIAAIAGAADIAAEARRLEARLYRRQAN